VAIVNCPECGGDVSDKAISCPHCGFPIEKYINEKKYESIRGLDPKIIHQKIEQYISDSNIEAIEKCAGELSKSNGIYEELFHLIKRKTETGNKFLELFARYYYLIRDRLDVPKVCFSDEKKIMSGVFPLETNNIYPDMELFSEIISVVDSADLYAKYLGDAYRDILVSQKLMMLCRNTIEYENIIKEICDQFKNTQESPTSVSISFAGVSDSKIVLDKDKICSATVIDHTSLVSLDVDDYVNASVRQRDEENWQRIQDKAAADAAQIRAFGAGLSADFCSSVGISRPQSTAKSAFIGGVLGGTTGAVIGAAYGISQNQRYSEQMAKKNQYDTAYINATSEAKLAAEKANMPRISTGPNINCHLTTSTVPIYELIIKTQMGLLSFVIPSCKGARELPAGMRNFIRLRYNNRFMDISDIFPQ